MQGLVAVECSAADRTSISPPLSPRIRDRKNISAKGEEWCEILRLDTAWPLKSGTYSSYAQSSQDWALQHSAIGRESFCKVLLLHEVLLAVNSG